MSSITTLRHIIEVDAARARAAMGSDNHFTLKGVAGGVWYTIHLAASQGNSQLVEMLMDSLKVGFVCPICREHIGEYLTNNQIPHSAEPRELFEWTAVFHNAVSARIGREVFTPERIERVYNEFAAAAKAVVGSEECVKNCDGVVEVRAAPLRNVSTAGSEYISY